MIIKKKLYSWLDKFKPGYYFSLPRKLIKVLSYPKFNKLAGFFYIDCNEKITNIKNHSDYYNNSFCILTDDNFKPFKYIFDNIVFENDK